METSFDRKNQDWMVRDPKNYKGGIFYFNPRDLRIIVPKRNRWMGWTFNFAKPATYLILVIFFLFVTLLSRLG